MSAEVSQPRVLMMRCAVPTELYQLQQLSVGVGRSFAAAAGDVRDRVQQATQ